MLIAKLVANDLAYEKLGRRGIDVGQAEQLLRNGAVPTRNPHPRVPGSVLLIGPTDGGRLLTLVLTPTNDRAIWQLRTAWDASRRERKLYYRRG